MHHLTMADKSLLIGDRAAALLVNYAALVAKTAGGDAIQLKAFGIDGAEVVVTVLLNAGTVLLVETTPSHLPEPDNSKLEEYLQGKLDGYAVGGMESWDDLLTDEASQSD